jgi:hypothetical protein
MRRAMRDDFSGEQMALNAPDEYAARIVFPEDLKVCVETVAIHFHVETAPLAFRTNRYLSALDFCSHWKNCVVRDQSFSPSSL